MNLIHRRNRILGGWRKVGIFHVGSGKRKNRGGRFVLVVCAHPAPVLEVGVVPLRLERVKVSPRQLVPPILRSMAACCWSPQRSGSRPARDAARAPARPRRAPASVNRTRNTVIESRARWTVPHRMMRTSLNILAGRLVRGGPTSPGLDFSRSHRYPAPPRPGPRAYQPHDRFGAQSPKRKARSSLQPHRDCRTESA
jgi:hypothetical protein